MKTTNLILTVLFRSSEVDDVDKNLINASSSSSVVTEDSETKFVIIVKSFVCSLGSCQLHYHIKCLSSISNNIQDVTS